MLRLAQLVGLLLPFSASLAACSNPPPPPAVDAGDPRIELGTGGIDVYEPIEEGATVELARGCQGGQHVWISVRAWALDTDPAVLTLRAVRAEDAAAVSDPLQLRVRFDAVPGEPYTEVLGIALVVPDVSQVLGRDIRIDTQVSESVSGGIQVEASRTVEVIWGDEICGGGTADSGVGATDGGEG